MRKIIVGDTHGCYKELVSLMRKVKLDRKNDTICFLGDYTDRGPESYKTTKYLQKMKKEMGDRCVLILGNHEQFVIDYVENHADDLWFINGGRTTFESFKKGVEKRTIWENRFKEYVSFLKESTSLFYDLGECYLAHASFLNEDPEYTAKSDPDHFVWDRTMLEYGLYNGKLGVVGHTPLANPTLSIGEDCGLGMKMPIFKTYEIGKMYDLPKKGLLCIDTCCFGTGHLTALVIENGKMKFYQTEKREE